MFIYRLNETPLDGNDIIFRTKGPGIALAITTCLTVTLLAFACFEQWIAPKPDTSPCLLFVITAVLGAFTWFLRSSYLKTRQPTNWLLRFNDKRLLIKFRSYLNPHFSEDDPQVFSLEPEEIAWIRKTHEKRTTTGLSRDGKILDRLTYLDIKIAHTDTRVLEALLLAEAARPAPTHGRLIKVSSKSQDNPIRLIDGNILRIRWKDKTGFIKPHIKQTLQILGAHFPIEPPENLTNDFTKTTTLTDAEKDNRIRELIAAGDDMAATALARQLYHLSLTEAHQKIETLRI